MRTNEDLWNDLTAIFRRSLDEDGLMLKEETTAADVPGWDSITHVLIIVAVEKHFKVKFTAGEIQRLQNVGQLAALIRSKAA
jgi:acyl carrier protein